MTTIKFLSAGLIAAVMFTISADAHENSVTKPHVVTKGNASASSTGSWIRSNARIPTPLVGEFARPPDHEPGGVCDFGDKIHSAEVRSGVGIIRK
jgi:hypothetical protein